MVIAPLVISFDPSRFPDRVRRAVIKALRAGRLPAAFLYESPAQASRWLAYHQAWSPSRRDEAARALYGVVFGAAARALAAGPAGPRWLIGLGCGGGHKDGDAAVALIEALAKASGAQGVPGEPGPSLHYVPIDASPPLVAEAALHVAARLPGAVLHPWVADLEAGPDVRAWLKEPGPPGPALFTCFGMLPNLDAPRSARYVAGLLWPGDRLLISANLSPGGMAADRAGILAQYDNPQARAWYAGALAELGLGEDSVALEIGAETLDEAGEAWRITVDAIPRRAITLRAFGGAIPLAEGARLRVFFSNRFTEGAARRLLEEAGLRAGQSWIDDTGEEGIFLCQRAGDG